MDPRDSPYRIPPGARPPTIPGSPTAARPYPWSQAAQDRRSNPRPLTHTQSSPPSPPSSRPGYAYYNDGSAIVDPLQSQRQGWSPPRPGAQPPNGYSNYRHPTQPVNGDRPTETWQFPEPQIIRSISHQSSLQPPQAYRPRAHSSTGVHPALGPSASHPNLKHKYSYSDGHGSKDWPVEGDINDAFEVSGWENLVK
jgi:hypothetical protein